MLLLSLQIMLTSDSIRTESSLQWKTGALFVVSCWS